MTSDEVTFALMSCSSKERAKKSAYFFKTEKGSYGEGDTFIGVTVPQQRKIAKSFLNIPRTELTKLLKSPIHEYRFTALVILCEQYKKADTEEQSRIAQYYLKNLKHVNNWDLVDVSAYYILGDYCRTTGSEKILHDLAKSKNLWFRRVSVVATWAYIRVNKLTLTQKITEMHLTDSEDLIHKACGWMLREVGKRDKEKLVLFLKKHSTKMPRTMLRYAIEKFPENERQHWLKK